MIYIVWGLLFIGLYLVMDIRKVGRSAVGWGIIALVMYMQAVVCFLSGRPIIGFLDLCCAVYDTILMGNRLHDYNVKKFNEENKHKSKKEQFLADIMNFRK